MEVIEWSPFMKIRSNNQVTPCSFISIGTACAGIASLLCKNLGDNYPDTGGHWPKEISEGNLKTVLWNWREPLSIDVTDLLHGNTQVHQTEDLCCQSSYPTHHLPHSRLLSLSSPAPWLSHLSNLLPLSWPSLFHHYLHTASRHLLRHQVTT